VDDDDDDEPLLVPSRDKGKGRAYPINLAGANPRSSPLIQDVDMDEEEEDEEHEVEQEEEETPRVLRVRKQTKGEF